LISRIVQTIEKGIKVFLVILMAMIIFSIALQVFGRYVGFIRYAVWTEELSRSLFVWIVYLGVVDALIKDKHLKVEIFVTKMPLVLRKTFHYISLISIICFCLALFIYGLSDSLALMDRRLVSLPFSAGVVRLIIPVSAFLMLLVLAHKLFVDFRHNDKFKTKNIDPTVK